MRKSLLVAIGVLAASSGQAADLNGVWHGTYNYAEAQPRSVEFTLNLCESNGVITGSLSEPATFGDKTSDTLHATLSGNVTGDRLKFRKVYDGTAGVRHSVDYDGKLEGTRVSGRWRIGEGNGPFEMELKAGTSGEAGCPKKEEPAAIELPRL